MIEDIARKWQRKTKQNHFLYFGLPFMSLMVVSSFVIAHIIEKKRQYNPQGGTKVSKEERQELERFKSKKPFDIREEYFVLKI